MVLRNFRKQIENVINQSGLSIDVIYFVIKDIYNEVVEIYSNEIKKEDAEAATQEEVAASEENKEEIRDE